MSPRAAVSALALYSFLVACSSERAATPEPDPEACLAERLSILDAMRDLAEQHGACAAPGDCVIADTGVSCQFECPVAIASASKGAFDAARAQLDAERCGAEVLRWCHYGAACAAPSGAGCVGGRCVAQFSMANDGGP